MPRETTLTGRIDAYKRAIDELSRPLPPVRIEGVPVSAEDMNNTTRKSYPMASAFAGAIFLAKARMEKLYGRSFTGDLHWSEIDSLAILVMETDADETCLAIPNRPKQMFPRWLDQPRPIDQAAAYFSLGIAHLFESEDARDARARSCFGDVLKIDPLNSAARSYVRDLSATPSSSWKDNAKTAADLGATLLSKDPSRWASVAAIFAKEFIDRMPSELVH
jgi:hypothetical protein